MNLTKWNGKNVLNNKCHKSVNMLMGQSNNQNKQQRQFNFTAAFTTESGIF